jgi:hypothetical protein
METTPFPISVEAASICKVPLALCGEGFFTDPEKSICYARVPVCNV